MSCEVCGGELKVPEHEFKNSTGDPYRCVNGCDYIYYYQGLGDYLIVVGGEYFPFGPYTYYGNEEKEKEVLDRLQHAIWNEQGKNVEWECFYCGSQFKGQSNYCLDMPLLDDGKSYGNCGCTTRNINLGE